MEYFFVITRNAEILAAVRDGVFFKILKQKPGDEIIGVGMRARVTTYRRDDECARTCCDPSKRMKRNAVPAG